MAWTKEQIDNVPEIYRDFMLALKPILDSRNEVFQISGIPLGRVYSGLSSKYAYGPRDVRQVADNLKEQGFIQEDQLGFLTLTGKGESFVKALVGEHNGKDGARVPPLPAL